MSFIKDNGAYREIHATAVPTVGDWNVGDRWFNTEPAAGESPGGVCVTAGAPGTWKVESPLSQGTTADVQHAKVAITSAQIKAIRATPISLVAAPGSGKVLQFLGAVLHLDYGTNAFTEAADNLGIKYTNGSGAQVSEDIETTGFIDGTADTIINAIPKKDVILVSNAALVLHGIGDAEIAGNAAGDNVVNVHVMYKVVTL